MRGTTIKDHTKINSLPIFPRIAFLLCGLATAVSAQTI